MRERGRRRTGRERNEGGGSDAINLMAIRHAIHLGESIGEALFSHPTTKFIRDDNNQPIGLKEGRGEGKADKLSFPRPKQQKFRIRLFVSVILFLITFGKVEFI